MHELGNFEIWFITGSQHLVPFKNLIGIYRGKIRMRFLNPTPISP
jgi:hypothetical protein